MFDLAYYRDDTETAPLSLPLVAPLPPNRIEITSNTVQAARSQMHQTMSVKNSGNFLIAFL
jgi:hypothetical protein